MNVDRPEPPYAAIPAAWASLTPEQRDQLGHMLIEWCFADFLSGDAYADHNQLCDENIRIDASDRRDNLMRELPERVADLFPDLFGDEPSDRFPDGMDPPWGWRDPAEMARAVERAGEAAEQAKRRVADLVMLAERRARREHGIDA